MAVFFCIDLIFAFSLLYLSDISLTKLTLEGMSICYEQRCLLECVNCNLIFLLMKWMIKYCFVIVYVYTTKLKVRMSK